MSNTRLTLLFFIILLNYTLGFAQFSLSGNITDVKTNLPLAGVELFNDVTKSLVVSDQKGVYRFNDLPLGNHVFTTFSTSFSTVTFTMNISADTIYPIQLEALSIELSAVEIAVMREELFAIKRLKDIEGTSIYAGKKSEVVVLDLVSGNLSSNNGRQVYAQVSGLNIYEGNDGGLQLNIGGRGLDPNRTSNFNTRQNGYDISADVLGYPENYYTPPSEALSEIRILRGASSLQYGTQFGGLIDFKIRKIPSFKKWELISNQTVGTYQALHSFNSFGANLGNLQVNTFYNYKQGKGYRANSNYNAHNLFLSADYALGKRTAIGFEFTYFNYLAKQAGGLTDQQFEADPTLSTRERNWFAVDWKLYNLNFEHRFKTRQTLSISIFGLDAGRKSIGFRGNPILLNENPITALDEKDSAGNYISPRDLIIGKFKNYGAEAKLLKKYSLLKKELVLLVGAKFYQSNNTSIQGPGSLGIDADFSLQTSLFPDYSNQSTFRFPNYNTALFIENIFYVSDKLSITPGLRWEFINTQTDGQYNQVVFDNAGNPIANNLIIEEKQLSRQFTLLGIGVNYKVNKKVNLIGNLSQNYKSVTFSDIRVVSPGFIVDPNIKDERGFTADLGINGRINNYLAYDFTVYSILYNDRIGIVLDQRANRVRKNIGKAIIGGNESVLNFNAARLITPGERKYKFNCFINNAFTFSEYLASDENNVVGKKVEFIPTFNLKSGINGGYKNWNASAQFTFISKQYTDVQNSLKASEGDVRSGIIGEIPGYNILDCTLSYQYKFLKLVGGINNLLNRSYFTRRATGYPGPGIIPSEGRSFFVTLSVKLDK